MALVAALAAIGWPAPAARAQADWSVKRDPFDRQLVARYKRLLADDPTDASALARLSALYKRYRSLDELIADYERELADRPSYAAAMVLAKLTLERGDPTAALAYYERAAEVSPDTPAAHLARAGLYRSAGRDDRAREAYTTALPLVRAPQARRDVLEALADLSLAAGDIETAERYYDEAIALAPKDVQTRIALADALARHGRHARAIDVLTEAEARLGADPARRLEVIARTGAVREALGEVDGALRDYRRALAMMRPDYHLRRELTDRIVDIYRGRQDLRGLITALERDWPAARRGHMEWDVLARLYEESGDQERATDAFRKAVAKAPLELDTQRRLIALLEHAGRDSDALRQYEAVIRVAPGEPRFQLELAQRYWRAAEQGKARALLRNLERRFGHDPGVQLAVANLYAEWGDDAASLEVYVRLTKLEPGELEHLVALGEQYFQRGQRDKAIATWKRIAARKDAEGLARLGDVYAEHDMPDEALEVFSRAIKADPDNPLRYRGRARVYERKRLYERAVEDWQRVLTLTPTTTAQQAQRREARRRVVALLRKSSRSYHRAKSGWVEVFYADPPDLEAGYLLVEAYLKDGDPRRAATALQRLLEANPDDEEAMRMLVKVYRSEERYDEAIALLERLATSSPGREREFYSEIAELKRLDFKDAEAIAYAEKALETSPNDAAAWTQLADTYEKMQRVDKAIEAYRRSLELAPRNFDVLFALAAIYERTGQRDAAAGLYRTVLQTATDEQILERAGDAAIALAEYDRSLGELERVVSPLAFAFAQKPIYRAIVVELYDRYVPRLVADTRADDPAEVEAARAELARLGAHGLKPLLEALAEEESPAQRRIAVTVLGHLGNRGAAVPLVKLATAPAAARRRVGTLQATDELDMRTEALVAAGRLGDPRVMPELVSLLSHPEVAMREAAAFALGVTGERGAVRPLLRALEDRRETVQVAAALALARLRDASGRDALLRLVASAEAAELARAAAAFALGYLGDRSAVPQLMATLDAGNGAPQRMAAWALGRLGDRRAVGPLIAAYFRKGAEVRQAIVWALPRAAAAQADRSPVRSLDDFPLVGDRGGRHLDAEAAVGSLLGDLSGATPPADLLVGREEAILDGLRAAFGSRNTSIILRALGDLDARTDGLALGALTAGLDDAPADRRAAAVAALCSIADALLPALEVLVRHDDSDVRTLALSVVAKTGRVAAAPILRSGLADARASVRRAAMVAAARLAATGATEALALAAPVADALGEPGWPERRAAVVALAAFADAAPVDRVAAALTDDNSFVREQAAVTLRALGRAEAVPALIDASRDPMPYVRVAVVKALAQLGGEAAERRLSEIAADDAEPQEVRAAARARSRGGAAESDRSD